jgi:hypothetical protein
MDFKFRNSEYSEEIEKSETKIEIRKKLKLKFGKNKNKNWNSEKIKIEIRNLERPKSRDFRNRNLPNFGIS